MNQFDNDTSQPKHLYIQTIGCQMNVSDSEKMARVLLSLGYHPTADLARADLVIVNTCSVRAKAEQKAFSALGRLAALKKDKPDLIVAVGGCVAQQEGQRIFKRAPYVDLVFGTHAISRLPALIARIETVRCKLVDTETATFIEEIQATPEPAGNQSPSRFVTIMRGCDNYCAYCVVPFVRGHEISRKPEHIIDEIGALVKSGVREITLLGQNVNSYGEKEGLCSFAELLARINDIEGLRRIRFTTSHPKDLSDALVEAFNQLDKLCSHVHLPVQSGSNRVLMRMNRKYTRELYLERVRRLKEVRPQMAFTSDMIVGFPGESRQDFEATLDLMRQVEFDGLFAFVYSDRPPAPAVQYPEKVAEKEKKQRLQELLALQEEYTSLKNRQQVGTQQSVLVEGRSRPSENGAPTHASDAEQWTGRTSQNKIVHFVRDAERLPDIENLVGQLVQVRIDRALSHSLYGKAIAIDPGCELKGEKNYAA